MLNLHRLLMCAALLALPVLAGCEMFSSEAWQRPSPLSGTPPPPPEKQEGQGGLAVLVEAPGQPRAARVQADLGAFAQGRGFVRQGSIYVLGEIKLDVVYRTSDLRVVANLHSFSSKLNRKFVDAFYQDFQQRYASAYGADAGMVENDFVDGGDGSYRSSGGGRSGGGRSSGGGGR